MRVNFPKEEPSLKDEIATMSTDQIREAVMRMREERQTKHSVQKPRTLKVASAPGSSRRRNLIPVDEEEGGTINGI